MVGELVRREAEIAIAPLTINSQREQVKLMIQKSTPNYFSWGEEEKISLKWSFV